MYTPGLVGSVPSTAPPLWGRSSPGRERERAVSERVMSFPNVTVVSPWSAVWTSSLHRTSHDATLRKWNIFTWQSVKSISLVFQTTKLAFTHSTILTARSCCHGLASFCDFFYFTGTRFPRACDLVSSAESPSLRSCGPVFHIVCSWWTRGEWREWVIKVNVWRKKKKRFQNQTRGATLVKLIYYTKELIKKIQYIVKIACIWISYFLLFFCPSLLRAQVYNRA